MPGGSFVTTGHTSGSAGFSVTACAAAGAPKPPAPMAVNAPPRNVRRFIMSDLPQRQSRHNLTGSRISASGPLRVEAEKLYLGIEARSEGVYAACRRPKIRRARCSHAHI